MRAGKQESGKTRHGRPRSVFKVTRQTVSLQCLVSADPVTGSPAGVA